MPKRLCVLLAILLLAVPPVSAWTDEQKDDWRTNATIISAASRVLGLIPTVGWGFSVVGAVVEVCIIVDLSIADPDTYDPSGVTLSELDRVSEPALLPLPSLDRDGEPPFPHRQLAEHALRPLVDSVAYGRAYRTAVERAVAANQLDRPDLARRHGEAARRFRDQLSGSLDCAADRIENLADVLENEVPEIAARRWDVLEIFDAYRAQIESGELPEVEQAAAAALQVDAGEERLSADRVLATSREGLVDRFGATVQFSDSLRRAADSARRYARDLPETLPTPDDFTTPVTGGRFSLDLGVGALGSSSWDDAEPAFTLSPRWRLHRRGDREAHLIAPLLVRPGDGGSPWDGDLSVDRLSPDSPTLSADVLPTGSAWFLVPGFESVHRRDARSSLVFSGGLGLRHERGGTAVVDGIGQLRTEDTTSPVATVAFGFERRITPRISLRATGRALVSYLDDATVDFAEGVQGRVDGGLHTEILAGLAIGFGSSSPEPAANPAVRPTVEVHCVPRWGRGCDQPGFGCLVMYPPDVLDRMFELEPGAPRLRGFARIGPGERPTLIYELQEPTELEELPLDRDVALADEVTAPLGLDHATITAGAYRKDPTVGTHGGFVFRLGRPQSGSADGCPSSPDER